MASVKKMPINCFCFQAVKLAMDLKKRLVDDSLLNVEQVLQLSWSS